MKNRHRLKADLEAEIAFSLVLQDEIEKRDAENMLLQARVAELESECKYVNRCLISTATDLKEIQNAARRASVYRLKSHITSARGVVNAALEILKEMGIE